MEQEKMVMGVDVATGGDSTAVVEMQDREVTIQKATELFGAYDKVNAIKKMRDDMKQQQLNVLGDNALADHLTKMISGLTPEEIRELSDEAVKEIYTDEKGEIEFALDLGEKELEFKRDFLVYLRESDIANEQFEKEQDELEKQMAEHQAEMQELIKEFGDLSTFMRTELQKQHDAAEGTRQERLAQVIAAYDDSYTLNRIIDHYEKFGVRNTVSDYYHRADDVFKKYIKTIQKLNFRTDLTSFNNLELSFLDEKYHVHPNLFLFAVIKMYAYKKDATPNTDGVFLSQFAVNLKSLYSDSFGSAEKKETFKAAITKVLDLFLGE